MAIWGHVWNVTHPMAVSKNVLIAIVKVVLKIMRLNTHMTIIHLYHKIYVTLVMQVNVPLK